MVFAIFKFVIVYEGRLKKIARYLKEAKKVFWIAKGLKVCLYRHDTTAGSSVRLDLLIDSDCMMDCATNQRPLMKIVRNFDSVLILNDNKEQIKRTLILPLVYGCALLELQQKTGQYIKRLI